MISICPIRTLFSECKEQKTNKQTNKHIVIINIIIIIMVQWAIHNVFAQQYMYME